MRGGNEGRCAWALNRDDPCLAWDQVGPAPASFQIDAGTERSILEYIAGTPGDTDFRFADLITGPGPTSDLFDPAPTGVTVRIVPEPATAALIALGLRRRSRVRTLRVGEGDA